MAFVNKAIYTVAYGLHNMQRSLCPGTNGLCQEMLPVNGSMFLQFLMNVSFTWGNETVKFDENGDPPGRYEIVNYRKVDDVEYDYVHVASWVSGGHLNIFEEIHWPANIGANSSSGVPESVCSRPCKKGQEKVVANLGKVT